MAIHTTYADLVIEPTININEHPLPSGIAGILVSWSEKPQDDSG